MSKKILVAIDIGTSSIKLLVGEKESDSSSLKIIAKEEVSHLEGVRKGEIYDSRKVAEKITLVKKRAEKTLGKKIKKALVNLGGPHTYVMESRGVVSVSRADQKISGEDIERVLQNARAVSLPSNKDILEVIPQEFIVDGESVLKEPLGLEGTRLEVKSLLVYIFSPVLEKLKEAFLESDIEIERIVPSPLASAKAVLTSEKKELGTAVLDIGAGTTSLAVFSKGKLIKFSIFPAGAANITNDIAIGLRAEIRTAENIKKEFGYLGLSKSKKGKKKVEIAEKNISFSRSFLKDIINVRVSEIFSETKKELKKISKNDILPGGVVLTGGGSLLPGIVDFAKKKFELPSIASGPKGIANLEDPRFSVSAGLLLFGFNSPKNSGRSRSGALNWLLEKIKNLIRIFLP